MSIGVVRVAGPLAGCHILAEDILMCSLAGFVDEVTGLMRGCWMDATLLVNMCCMC